MQSNTVQVEALNWNERSRFRVTGGIYCKQSILLCRQNIKNISTEEKSLFYIPIKLQKQNALKKYDRTCINISNKNDYILWWCYQNYYLLKVLCLLKNFIVKPLFGCFTLNFLIQFNYLCIISLAPCNTFAVLNLILRRMTCWKLFILNANFTALNIAITVSWMQFTK